jgi:hypothetical protein
MTATVRHLEKTAEDNKAQEALVKAKAKEIVEAELMARGITVEPWILISMLKVGLSMEDVSAMTGVPVDMVEKIEKVF